MKKQIIRVFYCLPMSNRPSCDIYRQINIDTNAISEYFRYDGDIECCTEVMCNYQPIDDCVDNISKLKTPALYFLGRGIMEMMSKCDYVVFADDWENSNGCQCEKMIAETYGLKIKYLKDIYKALDVTDFPVKEPAFY